MSEIRLESNKGKKNHCTYVFDNEKNILGEGGMGVVFLGTRIDANGIESKVAIKELKIKDKEIVERARREASIQLNNDNLVRMYGMIETESNDVLHSKNYYVISEYLKGVMLDAVLDGDLKNRDGKIYPEIQKFYDDYNDNRNTSSTHIVKCVLSGIMALHDAGYIHRDIDPTNIMVTSDGKVKLIDFGIAKKLETMQQQKSELTTPGQFIGKAEYAAPELILGDSANQNFYTDIYAIGILYYQLVVGHVPFQGSKYDVIDCQLHKKIPLKNISSWQIKDIIAQATEKKQIDRFASAALFRAAIDNISYPEKRKINYKQIGIAAVAILIIALIAIIVKMSSGGGSTKETKITTDSIAPVDSFQLYLNQLNYANDDSINSGFKGMMTLAENGNVDAMYEIAVTFSSKAREDDASSATRKLGLKLKTDMNDASAQQNKKAVEWLQKVIEATDSTNYKALYRLSPYYFYGMGGLRENPAMCKKLLTKAHKLAIEARDNDYISRTERLLENMK